MPFAGCPVEHTTTAVDILEKIKADFVDCRSMLLKIVRVRASFRSILTGNRSKLSDGSKELDATFSSIIDKLGDLSSESNISMDDNSNGIRDLRRIEKILRDKVLEELLGLKTDKTLDVDYDRISRDVTSLYDGVVNACRDET